MLVLSAMFQHLVQSPAARLQHPQQGEAVQVSTVRPMLRPEDQPRPAHFKKHDPSASVNGSSTAVGPACGVSRRGVAKLLRQRSTSLKSVHGTWEEARGGEVEQREIVAEFDPIGRYHVVTSRSPDVGSTSWSRSSRLLHRISAGQVQVEADAGDEEADVHDDGRSASTVSLSTAR